MLYRIITQNKNRNDIIAMLRRQFGGFVFYKGTGVYTTKRGTRIESTLIIELDDIDDYAIQDDYAAFHKDGFSREVEDMVIQIKKINQQGSVLLQTINSESEMI